MDNHYFLRFYFIIDEIWSMEIFMTFKKKIMKLLAIVKHFCSVNIILISNFDIVRSELKSIFQFDDFVSVQFPKINKKMLKAILKENNNCNSPQVDDIINKIIASFEYPIINLNEKILCTRENIDKFGYVRKEDYNHQDVFRNISNQIQVSPIHITPIETFLVNNKNAKKNSIINLDKPNTSYANEMLKPKHNFTDSLSKTQKLLLLSAFFANETEQRFDKYIFQSSKRQNKKYNSKIFLDTGISIRRKMNSFTTYRLIAIYSSLCSIINDSFLKEKDINIELISDIGTLVHSSLIKTTNKSDNSLNNIMSLKFSCSFLPEFAVKLAEDFDIHLDDFVHYNE